MTRRVALSNAGWWVTVVVSAALSGSLSGAEPFDPEIPRTWVDSEMAELELPLADPARSPVHLPSELYYQIPERTLYKTYPVYHPDHEPEGYLEDLMSREPEVIFDRARLETKEDWVQVGRLLFESSDRSARGGRSAEEIRRNLPAWVELWNVPATPDGIIPFRRYVVREQGQVELQSNTCASCHTRIMPDGTVVVGAQGNVPAGAGFFGSPPKNLLHALLDTPWSGESEVGVIDSLSEREIVDHLNRIPSGVITRTGTSFFYPVAIPDLIGVRDRRFLDHTGLQRHSSIVDLMRYATINFDFDMYANFGGFRPYSALSGSRHDQLPEPDQLTRYSDPQLYAIALYVYSLEPPTNPHAYDEQARHGEMVFNREGCTACHTAPLYTNNKLTPVDGFDVPPELRNDDGVLDVVVGTDPNLALRTRRGTGFYKVPSLKGVWYRGPFEHSGSVATLEDWFDPARLEDDYVPTGYVGHGVETRSVRGHEFGLKLSPDEKAALIAFLRTL